jgi:hypothetical protein
LTPPVRKCTLTVSERLPRPRDGRTR